MSSSLLPALRRFGKTMCASRWCAGSPTDDPSRARSLMRLWQEALPPTPVDLRSLRHQPPQTHVEAASTGITKMDGQLPAAAGCCRRKHLFVRCPKLGNASVVHTRSQFSPHGQTCRESVCWHWNVWSIRLGHSLGCSLVHKICSERPTNNWNRVLGYLIP